MAGAWYIHDAGFFTLELPHGWLAEQPNTGTLLIQDPHAEVALWMVAISRVPPNSTRGQGRSAAGTNPLQHLPVTSATGLDAQFELQKWIQTQRHVEVPQAPRLLAGTRYATATAEGLQRLHAKRSWLARVLGRLRGTGASLMLWRFWATLNPHMLLLASCNGYPAMNEKHRAAVDRILASITLPERTLLIGRQFTEKVISLARSWFPQMAVNLIDDAHLQFGSQNLSLAGLHRRYLASPEELSTQVRAFLTAVQINMPASALANSWRHASERIMPVFLTRRLLSQADGAAREHILHEEWINGLSIGYALEDQIPEAAEDAMPEPSQRIIMREDVKRWKVDAERLHAQAMQNLIIYSHEQVMEGRQAEGLTMLTLARPDRHNAARILLPELHQKLREHLGPTFLAALPTREVLVAFNVSDPELMTQIRQDVGDDFAHSQHGLSPKFFLVTPDGIAGDPDDVEEFPM